MRIRSSTSYPIYDDLKAPCSYQGGKARIADELVSIMNVPKSYRFYDLCCGAGSVSLSLVSSGFNPRQVVMVDSSPWGLFWNSIGTGDFDVDHFKWLIDNIPEDRAEILLYLRDLAKRQVGFDREYVFLILQAGSFGGKSITIDNNRWVTQGHRELDIPMKPMPNTLFTRVSKIAQIMKGITGICDVVNNISVDDTNRVVYMDPPYTDTTGYKGNLNIRDMIYKFKPIWISNSYPLADNAILVQTSSERKSTGITGMVDRKPHTEWFSFCE